MAERQNRWLSLFQNHFAWAKDYNGQTFSGDFVAGLIVTILLVPQSLAYAMLAGLPAIVGIYASILPLLAYALFGSSRQLAVGPTAIISLLTAVSLSVMPEELRLVSAAALALMVGGFLMLAGLLRAGFIMNFVSRPVVAAYISGSAILIILSQLRHVLGIEAAGNTAFKIGRGILAKLSDTNIATVIIGVLTMIFLILIKRYLAYLLVRAGMRAGSARIIARVAPIFAVITAIATLSYTSIAQNNGVAIIGEIPQGLPSLAFPVLEGEHWQALVGFAAIIALVAFVDSISIAQTFAARSRTRIDANKEMLGLGASNFAAGLSGGYPVTGSFSRSAVNFNAGAVTPLAGVFTAILMALTALFFTPLLANLPVATLAAMIIVACLGLIDLRSIWETWTYSKGDGLTAGLTFMAVLLLGVQWGVLVGVVLAMALHIRKTLRPHMALVGRFAGTEHYRNEKKYRVETFDEVKTLRIDESLYYANARYLEDKVARIVEANPKMRDLILMCPAVNYIDASALRSLEEINSRLKSVGVSLHFSELKSYVADPIRETSFFEKLTGRVFLSQFEAMQALEPEPDWSQFSDHIDIH